MGDGVSEADRVAGEGDTVGATGRRGVAGMYRRELQKTRGTYAVANTELLHLPAAQQWTLGANPLRDTTAAL